MVIARKIYDLAFFDKVRSALKLQGRIPDKISNDIRLVVVGNPKHAAQWTIPRGYRGILKKQIVSSIAAGKDSLIVPVGKIWELVGWRVSMVGDDIDIEYDNLTIAGNEVTNSYDDSGDVSHFPITGAKEHIIIGGQTPVGSTTGVATAPYTMGCVVDTLLNLFFNMPLLVRNEISLEWYGTFADSSVRMIIWYYERNIESWETIQQVNR